MKRIASLQISVVIIGAIAILCYVSVQNLISSFELVNHTHEVMHQIKTIKDDMADCQTSIREFTFSDGPESNNFINLYLEKSPGIEKELDELTWLTRDNELQQKNCYELRMNINRKLQVFRDAYEMAKSNRKEDARKFLVSKFGEPWIQSLRNVTNNMEQEEQRLLSYRLKDVAEKSNLALYGIPILMIIYVCVFGIALNSLRKTLESCP